MIYTQDTSFNDLPPAPKTIKSGPTAVLSPSESSLINSYEEEAKKPANKPTLPATPTPAPKPSVPADGANDRASDDEASLAGDPQGDGEVEWLPDDGDGAAWFGGDE
jgi:hypothetical protein